MLLRGLLSATLAMVTHADIDRLILGMIRLCVEKCPLDAPEKADEISGAIGEITVLCYLWLILRLESTGR